MSASVFPEKRFSYNMKQRGYYLKYVKNFQDPFIPSYEKEENKEWHARGKGGVKTSNTKDRFCLQTWTEKMIMKT